MAEPRFGPEQFASAVSVSRETLDRLVDYGDLLAEWSARHNLVSARSLGELWNRHMLDSAQLAPLVPENAKTLVDLGSGAGFPGLVLASLLGPRIKVTLYEATGKKCRFLGEAAQKLGLSVDIRNARIEDAKPEAFDVVTARACAPLPKLLAYAWRFQGPQTVNLFLKGQNVEVELREAYKIWTMNLRDHASISADAGRVLEIRDLAHGASAHGSSGGTIVEA